MLCKARERDRERVAGEVKRIEMQENRTIHIKIMNENQRKVKKWEMRKKISRNERERESIRDFLTVEKEKR